MGSATGTSPILAGREGRFRGSEAHRYPDLIFTHGRDDLHQDHRLACELTWNTWRNNVILEYEIPKYDGDLGTPNVFIPLDEAAVEEKLELLREHYATQRGKHWFDDDLFRGLMRLRGMEAAAVRGGVYVPEAHAPPDMIFQTAIAGVWVVEPERHADERGFFARTWDGEELAERGLNGNLAQCSISYNRRRGTLRGMHLQAPPHEEAKLVRCTAGAIFDVALDLRPDRHVHQVGGAGAVCGQPPGALRSGRLRARLRHARR